MFRDSTPEELAAMQEAAAAHIANLQYELDELGAPMGDERYDSPEWVERAVDLELKYRFQARDQMQAAALRDDLRKHGILICRYDLGSWIRVGTVIQ